MFTEFDVAKTAESLPLQDNTGDQDAKAARLIARNARDKHDLTELLDALALPTDADSITDLLPLIPDPTEPATLMAGTTGDDSDMPTTEQQPTATPTAEEAMAVSMHYADHPMADIVEATGLTEQQIHALVDAFEAEIEAVQTAENGSTTADIVAAVDGGTEALLAWAEQHDLASIRSRAARVRSDLAELADRRGTEQATAEAEARVAEAKAALEAAQAELRAVKTGTARTATMAPNVPAPAAITGGKRGREELARIRAWARENGYQVGVAGVVKKTILDAYDAAHSPARLAQAS
jgi:hypothetical protein